ncbi:hypothetical protein [Enterobacter roggenkampii]|uniref:hypothetical protein n=1 Tax=Enterobacter roggenkampii TaxID=1812935 RepID=UPI002006BC16|nr:hypothetical protein [Enterobacter roggenkampii]MCK6840184.1 hypothetical protein [Enterobacter roggenkampii]
MNTEWKCIKFIFAFILAFVANGLILFLLKLAGLTTLGSLGVFALILTVIPGIAKVRENFQYVEFLKQKIDFWFLSGVAVAFVSIPVAVLDKSTDIHDRWGYGVVGTILIAIVTFPILKPVYIKIIKALEGLY